MLSDTEAARENAADLTRTELAAIVQSSLAIIFTRNLDGCITSWNGGAERFFEYSAGEIVGRPIRQLVPEERWDEEDRILAEIREGVGTQCLETLRRTRDGRLMDVSVSVSPIRDDSGRVVGASEIAHDISALREHEREISRMVRLYSALSQVNQAIVGTTDRDALFGKVCQALVQHGGLCMAWIGWKDRDSQRLLQVAEFNDLSGYLQGVAIHLDDSPEGRGPAGQSFRTGHHKVCNDVESDPDMALPREALARVGYRSVASFPLRLGGEVGGVLNVYADKQGFFREKEVALLVEAAMDVSYALDNMMREETRRQAEDQLREETQFSRIMLESMPGIAYFYDTSGRFLRWNRNFETVTGCSGHQIAGSHPLDFFSSADKPLLEQRIGEVFETGEASVEADFLVAGGSTRPYFFTGRRVEFRSQACLVGVGIDISQRKKAEVELRESRAHLLEAQRIAGIGSWSLALATGELALSDQTCEIFGVDRQAALLDLAYFMQFVHPDDRQAVEVAFSDAMSGRAQLDIEHRIVLGNGTEKMVHERALIQRGISGEAMTLAGTMHDITVRVRLEAERERRHRAEAADHVKSAFLATMSHELRTPLNSIVGFTGVLLRGLAGPLNSEQGKQLGMVRDSARHLLALVNDVLDISKIEAGQLEVARAPFDPLRSLIKLADLVAPQAEAKGLTLRLRLPPDLGTGFGDERRFEQILLNLLSNAVKFTEQGEIVLAAELLKDETRFQVSVSDTGIGISRQDMLELFKPFRQIDSGLSRSHEGTGLGLAICRRLAGLLGGEIHVESEPGRGSRFTVTLPLHPAGVA